MSRFAEGTDPEYIKKVNDALYGAGKDDAEVKEELLAEAEVIGPGDNVGTKPAEVKPKKAGFMGLPNLAWIAIIGVGVYYAYSKGIFKK
jgi:hypothetical protein|tara:strand:- start:6882 stop:7148 length:267 start_codon:yes stop_codon:yes gene_type:complete